MFLTTYLGVVLTLVAFSARLGAAFSNFQFAGHHKHQANHRFSLSAKQGSRDKWTGKTAYAAAHVKWGATMSPHLAKHWEMSTGGDAGALSIHSIMADLAFAVDVGIGSPPQTVSLIFDTGSADLWTEPASDKKPSKNSLYNPGVSRSAKNFTNATWGIAYVDGSFASGDVYGDLLRLGPLALPNMTIEIATAMSNNMGMQGNATGIMGVAMTLPTKVRPTAPSLVDRLREALAEPVFTVDLHPSAGDGLITFGSLSLNGTSAKAGTGSGGFSWTTTDPDSPYWDFNITAFRFSGMPAGHWWGNHVLGSADTGTTLLLMPDWLCGLYWAGVPGATRDDPAHSGSWVFPCTSVLPDLVFQIEGGYQGTVPGRFFNDGPVGGDGDNATCYGGMQSSEPFGIEAIFGAVLLKSQVVAFNFGNNSLGFASKNF